MVAAAGCGVAFLMVLAAAGSDFTKVVKCNVYLKNMDDFAAMNAVYGKHFTGEAPPARSTVEVARLPNRFQSQCAGDVVARYAPREDGSIDVTNRCRTASGETDEADGLAMPQDETNARLKVSFLPAALRWLPFGRGDYWVLALDADYRWAMVGAPSRDYLWILSRTPALPDERLELLLGQAREMGFPADRVVRTPHEAALR